MTSSLLHCYYEGILHRCSRLPEKIPSNRSRCVCPKLFTWTNITPLFSYTFFFICLTGRGICSVANSESSASNRKNTHVLLDPTRFPLTNFLQEFQQQKPRSTAVPKLCVGCPASRPTRGSVEEKRFLPPFTSWAHPIHVPERCTAWFHGGKLLVTLQLWM